MGDEKIKSTKTPDYGKDFWLLRDPKAIEEYTKSLQNPTGSCAGPATREKTPEVGANTNSRQRTPEVGANRYPRQKSPEILDDPW